MNALIKDPLPEPQREEPMSRHTSWRVGGPAELFFEPATVYQLQVFLRQLPESVPVQWLGLGSNLLVRDGGIRGAVISTAKLARAVERGQDGRVAAGCSVPCANLARQCVRWHLGPASFLAGIPGSIGGALAMNAGAFGHETWEFVESVTTIDRRGDIRVRPRSDYRIAYRSVEGPAAEWFLGAVFAFAKDESVSAESIRALLRQRKATQPLGQPSCGSVFRNPPGGFAGRLIEAAGLKGKQVGGARISDKHANFIVNIGGARAADIEHLIRLVRAEVKAQHGVDLELEVRIVGDPAPGDDA
jgi:UDP-N-acetylmuramate dehydrogenase